MSYSGYWKVFGLGRILVGFLYVGRVLIRKIRWKRVFILVKRIFKYNI